MLPPLWLRRLVLGPAVLVLSLLAITGLPVLLIGGALLSTFLPGRWRPFRLLWMALLYLFLEAVALLVLLALWIGSGFGWRIRSPWFQRAHYVLVKWFLQVLFRESRRVLHVRVTVEGPPPPSYDGRPLLILSRHAGPGDSFILIHALVNWFDREPRIVLKHTLQWDPVIDVMLNRLPNHFLTAGGGDPSHGAALATGLDENDALVLFPEGGNFTPSRRERAIQRLRDLGLEAMAERATRLRHVMAPRPGGTLAALDAAPGAGVIWVAHTGTDKLLTAADVWRHLPLDATITMRWWSVDAAEVPVGHEQRVDWLYEWWARIDAWIGQHS
jgi:1-acyl-sn-glycerol-3-phosphate acyltransferase